MAKKRPTRNGSLYLAELQALLAEAQSKTGGIYATPLPVVEKRIEAMKQLLEQGRRRWF